MRGTGQPVANGVVLAVLGAILLAAPTIVFLGLDAKDTLDYCDWPDAIEDGRCDTAKARTATSLLVAPLFMAGWMALGFVLLVLGATALHGRGRQRALRDQATARLALLKQWYVEGLVDDARFKAHEASLLAMQRGGMPGLGLARAGAGLYTAAVLGIVPAFVVGLGLMDAAAAVAGHLPWAPAAVLPWAVAVAAMPIVVLLAGLATRAAGDHQLAAALGRAEADEADLMAAARSTRARA